MRRGRVRQLRDLAVDHEPIVTDPSVGQVAAVLLPIRERRFVASFALPPHGLRVRPRQDEGAPPR